MTVLIYTTWSNCLGLSSSFFEFWVHICFLKSKKLFMDAYVGHPIFPRTGAPQLDLNRITIPRTPPEVFFFWSKFFQELGI